MIGGSMESNEVKIARLEEQVRGLRDDVSDMSEKLDEITELLNKGRGAFAFAIFIAGLAGAAVTKGLSAVFTVPSP
jgi:hypothetical protein